jgi:rubrerythrin
LGKALQFFKKKKGQSEEDPRSKGLVKWGDEWITPAEKYRREHLGANVPVIREKETIVTKEIVKIRCKYCGTVFNIAENDKCPHCGAPP